VRKLAEEYYNKLSRHLTSIRVTGENARSFDFFEGIEKVGNIIKSQTEQGYKIMFIGNGASAAISSHMSTDFWKNGGMKALAFNDSSLLTCIGNDFGYEYIFEKSIEMFADRGDVLIAISSSGKSKNILRGTQSARLKGCSIITLSGFKDDNPLSSMGDYNFYVPAQYYGPVEIAHHSICHCILDIIISHKQTQSHAGK